MHFSSYGPLKFILKSIQNAKLAVNHTLRWNSSNFDQELGDHFNFEQLHGWNEFRNYPKVSGAN